MPRYSTGCKQCLRRRIKCDETTPICVNCEKKNLKCSGPRAREDIVFINQNDWARKATDSTAIVSTNRPTRQHSIALPRTTVTWSKYDVHTQLCFLWRYWNGCVGPSAALNSDSSWMQVCRSRPEEYPIASSALNGLAAAFFGRRHHHAAITDYASQLYGKVLVVLRGTLEKSRSVKNFDIFAAISALRRYEDVMCTSITGWRLHLDGMSRFVEEAGPEYFSRYPQKSLLDSSRLGLVLEDYCKRRRTFLDKPEWQAVLTKASPQEKPLEGLMDSYAKLAGLSEDITTLLADGDFSDARVLPVASDADALLDDLDQWCTDFMAIHPPTTVAIPDTDTFYKDSLGHIISSKLTYSTSEIAMAYNVYRYLKITTLEWHHKIYNPYWWPGENREAMADIPQVHELAQDIVRTLHVHFPSDRAEGEQVQELVFLLMCGNAANKVFTSFSRETIWIKRIMEMAADRSGLELPRKLSQLFPIKWHLASAQVDPAERWESPKDPMKE